MPIAFKEWAVTVRALAEGEPPPHAVMRDGGISQPDRVRIRAWAEVAGAWTVTDRRVVDGLAWSADGRRLLLSWRGAGEWLLLGTDEKVRALHGVTRELGAGGGFPRVVSWCCPR